MQFKCNTFAIEIPTREKKFLKFRKKNKKVWEMCKPDDYRDKLAKLPYAFGVISIIYVKSKKIIGIKDQDEMLCVS